MRVSQYKTALATACISISFSAPAWSASFALPSGFDSNLAEQFATSIYFYSQPGDYIGQGQEQLYTPEDGEFLASGNSSVVGVRFDNFDLVEPKDFIWWTANFSAPLSETLQVGSYEGATRYPFQDNADPGLSFTGSGRGCNRSGGQFDIVEIEYGDSGVLSSFDAIFAQYCENESGAGSPALFGRVRFNAGLEVEPEPEPVPEPASVLGLLALAGVGTATLRKRDSLKA